MRLALLSLLLILTGCGEAPPEEAQQTAGGRLRVGEVLGGESGGFLRADAPRRFVFPRDHGPHPGYRNEWWYLTGNLAGPDGRRYAYQVTFFRHALTPPEGESEEGPRSAWRGTDVWMAHAALTDVAAGRHYPLERFSRENPGLAGAGAEPFQVWLEDWRLWADGDPEDAPGAASGAAAPFPWRLRVQDAPFDLELALRAEKPPVLQGDAGLSRKSGEPGNASYYYSMTRLATEGEIRVGDERVAVRGESWLDREWSTSALAPDQTGWDWFSLQLEDDRELMYYRLRDAAGQTHPFSGGNLTSPAGQQTPIRSDDLQLTELAHWTSPLGVRYATRWRLTWGDRRWVVRALLEDQWMDVSVTYWEGAVEVLDEAGGERIGRGFVEMVREQRAAD